MPPATPIRASNVAISRRALAGFFLSGTILSFPGSILPAWGYSIRPHFVTIGLYFLVLVCGILISVAVSRFAVRRHRSGTTLVVACAMAAVLFVLLSFTAPPVREAWRLPWLAGLGVSAGLLNTAVFQTLSPAYRADPAGTVNRAGIYFGCGSIVSPLLISGAFGRYSVSTILYILAAIPALLAILYFRTKLQAEPLDRDRTVGEVLHKFTIPGAVLLSLLLFFHFGNEWTIAGWLPLYLVLRLGLNPATALLMLAGYWLALMLVRLAVQTVLPRISHTRLLIVSILASLFGLFILAFTNNFFGACWGTLLVGAGFGPIYPLVVERIGLRFPHFHPGLFNGIFSVALTGGMLAPATLGFGAELVGLGAAMLLPVAGTLIVLLLVLVIWAEAQIAEWNSAKPLRRARN